MAPSSTEERRSRQTVIALGAIGLILTLGNTLRLFVQARDHSAMAAIVWGAFGLWLPVSFVWTLRRIRRIARLPSDASRAVRDELQASTTAYLILGYGTAAFALSVIQVCVRR